MKQIAFSASLPNIQSAIQIHGGGDGFLVKLDVPLSDRMEMMKLACCDNQSFKVTIKVKDGKGKSKSKGNAFPCKAGS